MLIDRFLPNYQTNELHHTLVRATKEKIYPVMRRIDLSRSPISSLFGMGISVLRRLRGKPNGTKPGLNLDFFLQSGFMILDENGNDEVVLGLVQKVGFGDRTPKIGPGEFSGFETPGYFKAAWNFHLADQGRGLTRLSTETRVQCYGAKAHRIFMAYWLLIKPMSGLTRMEMLRALKKASEA